MRRILLYVSFLMLGVIGTKAQSVATFDTLSLPNSDTAYINYSNPGNDVGFSCGLAYFSCVYDTGFGSSYWSSGFAYSNKHDSVTSGFMNQYSAKTAIGYGGSAKYAVAYASYPVGVKLLGIAAGQPVSGFYATNNTYAFNSIRDGDTYAKKFGDTTGTGVTTGQGTAPDWFKLTVHGYLAGVVKPSSVDFYLADYRFAHSDSDYIVNTWEWVNLRPLGNVDSLSFSLSSSDNGSFGMNTPAYFCMDDFATHESSIGVAETPVVAARVYPNPTTDILNIDLTDDQCQSVAIVNVKGEIVYAQNIAAKHIEINTSTLPAGVYVLRLTGSRNASMRFIKQ